MATINTNPGAMIALQNLNKTNMDLQQVQQRINTGLAVSSAKDNGGVFAIAQSMRADVGGYKAVTQSLDLATSTVDVALAAGEAISDLLVEMKEKALAGADTSLDTASRNALNEDFKALRDQINTIVSNAEFNGTNLIDGSNTAGISALANADGSNTITINDEDMSLGGTIVTVAATASFGTAAAASTQAAAIETSLDNLNASLARLGTGSKSLEVHKTLSASCPTPWKRASAISSTPIWPKSPPVCSRCRSSSSWAFRRSPSPTRRRARFWASSDRPRIVVGRLRRFVGFSFSRPSRHPMR
jgi:flagellin